MNWNYRLVRRRFEKSPDYELFAIHEVYYDNQGKIITLTVDPVNPTGDSKEDIMEAFALMQEAFDAPILDYDNCIDPEAEQQLSNICTFNSKNQKKP